MPICVDKLCKRPARASVQVGASQATSCLAHGSSLDLRSILSPSQREPSPTLNLRTSPYVKLRRQGSVKPRLLRLRDHLNMNGRGNVVTKPKAGTKYMRWRRFCHSSKSPISPSRKIRSGSIGCLKNSPTVSSPASQGSLTSGSQQR